MLLLILAFLGGVLTIFSPCILPVLPFVFARVDRPFWKSGLPLLVGMALSFAVISTLASVGGAWVVQANQYGRTAALILLVLFALTMIAPELAERLTRPLVHLGGNLAKKNTQNGGIVSSVVLGIATGLLWAPCAGPILGLVLTGAALSGGHLWAGLLLFSYAVGAAAALGLVLLGGQKVLGRLKRSLGFEQNLRKGLGVAIIIGVWMIMMGFDRGILSHLSEGSTTPLEKTLIRGLSPSAGDSNLHGLEPMAGTQLNQEGRLPLLPTADNWVNSPPLTAQNLRGKVVLIDFWTYSCINCIRTIPVLESWYTTYKNKGLVVIGIHSPEFAFEKLRDNVEMAIHQFGITYPVAMDNDLLVWNAFHNEYWPAQYLVDAKGMLRYHHFGEGDDMQTEAALRALLIQRGTYLEATANTKTPTGVEAEGDTADDLSPETYLGKERAERFDGAVAAQNPQLELNHWGVNGKYTQSLEKLQLIGENESISFRFHARDVHLVLGPAAHGTPVYFQVFLDGKPVQGVKGGRGEDVDEEGRGVVNLQRLYQLIRQKGRISDHTLTIKFEQAGVEAFAFTFG